MMRGVLNWIAENKQWLFSGIGIVVLAALARFVYRIVVAEPGTTEIEGGDIAPVQTGPVSQLCALPRIERLPPEAVDEYYANGDRSKGGLRCAFRNVAEDAAYGDMIFGETEITAFGPVSLPKPRRDGPIHAADVAPMAEYAAESWHHDASLVYIAAGALDIAYSNTRGYYFLLHRWLFLYRARNCEFLLVCVDPGPELRAMIEWSDRHQQFGSLDPIQKWNIDAMGAADRLLTKGVVPTLGTIFLRMNRIRGSFIPTWFFSFNGVYQVSATDKNVVFDPLEEGRENGHVHEYQNDAGDSFETVTYRRSWSQDYVNNVIGKRMAPTEWELEEEKDFRTGVVVSYRFRNSTVFFFYDEPIALFRGVPNRARCRAGSGTLLGEAQMDGTDDGGYRIRERHFDNDGKIRYEGHLVFTAGVDFAVRTSAVSGSKETELFFFWPASR